MENKKMTKSDATDIITGSRLYPIEMSESAKVKQSKRAINLTNYTRPNTKELLESKEQWILNGENNSYYQYLEDCFYASATNGAIIEAYCDYIYAEGLFNNGVPIKDIMANEDLRLLINDLETLGNAAAEIVYDMEGKVESINFVDVSWVGIRKEETLTRKPKIYGICPDWENQAKCGVILVPRFGTTDEEYNELEEMGIVDGNDEPLQRERELLFIRKVSKQPYFSLPSYEQATEWCEFDQEFQHYCIQHIKNGLSFGHIINVVKGMGDTPEGQRIAERKMVQTMTSPDNAGRFLFSFNDNAESKTTIDAVTISDAHKQYTVLTQFSREQILMAHGVVNPILFGVKEAGGFGNNADEMEVALKTIYRSKIKPRREIIIDALESVIKINDPLAELNFKDFDELTIKDKVQDAINLQENIK